MQMSEWIIMVKRKAKSLSEKHMASLKIANMYGFTHVSL